MTVIDSGCFLSPARITQYFGENPKYYKKYNLLGHEGLDLVPVDSDWTVVTPIAGKVVRAYFSEVYGNTCIIHNAELSIAVRLAHLNICNVTPGELVPCGKIIGLMGNTPGTPAPDGQAMRAHLHVSVVPVETWPTRLYINNGFKGRVDPLPVLTLLQRLRECEK